MNAEILVNKYLIFIKNRLHVMHWTRYWWEGLFSQTAYSLGREIETQTEFHQIVVHSVTEVFTKSRGRLEGRWPSPIWINQRTCSQSRDNLSWTLKDEVVRQILGTVKVLVILLSPTASSGSDTCEQDQIFFSQNALKNSYLPVISNTRTTRTLLL